MDTKSEQMGPELQGQYSSQMLEQDPDQYHRFDLNEFHEKTKYKMDDTYLRHSLLEEKMRNKMRRLTQNTAKRIQERHRMIEVIYN
jgi:hypothetical protein